MALLLQNLVPQDLSLPPPPLPRFRNLRELSTRPLRRAGRPSVVRIGGLGSRGGVARRNDRVRGCDGGWDRVRDGRGRWEGEFGEDWGFELDYRRTFDGIGLVSYTAAKWASPSEFATGALGLACSGGTRGSLVEPFLSSRVAGVKEELRGLCIPLIFIHHENIRVWQEAL